jgi:hypothetical protein
VNHVVLDAVAIEAVLDVRINLSVLSQSVMRTQPIALKILSPDHRVDILLTVLKLAVKEQAGHLIRLVCRRGAQGIPLRFNLAPSLTILLYPSYPNGSSFSHSIHH